MPEVHTLTEGKGSNKPSARQCAYASVAEEHGTLFLLSGVNFVRGRTCRNPPRGQSAHFELPGVLDKAPIEDLTTSLKDVIIFPGGRTQEPPATRGSADPHSRMGVRGTAAPAPGGGDSPRRKTIRRTSSKLHPRVLLPCSNSVLGPPRGRRTCG